MVAILGGGIAGLTAAHYLRKRQIDFELFEASDEVGGKIRSERTDGFLVEHGPNSLPSSSPLLQQIVQDLDLSDQVVFAAPNARKRFVVRHGEPVELPLSPPALLTSGYFSFRTKLLLAREPLLAPKSDDEDESVAAFARRRLGNEVLDYAVDPFVTGVFAGDPELLSLRHAFPALYRLEQDHGSLIKGLLASKPGSTSPPHRRIFSFREGMQTLPVAMSHPIADRIKTNHAIRAIRQEGARWRLNISWGDREEERLFDRVISTLPLPRFCELGLSTELDLSPLEEVPHPPVGVLVMGFEADRISHPLDGFGMLVPGKESTKRILGTIFSSTIFPDRAPEGKTLLTTLVGGARRHEIGLFSLDFLQEFVLEDLHHTLGVHADPVFVRHVIWEEAIPQYHVGYGVVKALLNNLEAVHPGLYFAGNYRQGISVIDAIQSGHDAVSRLAGNDT